MHDYVESMLGWVAACNGRKKLKREKVKGERWDEPLVCWQVFTGVQRRERRQRHGRGGKFDKFNARETARSRAR